MWSIVFLLGELLTVVVTLVWHIVCFLASLLWAILENLWEFSWYVLFPFVYSCLHPLFSSLPSVASWVWETSFELFWALGQVLGQVAVGIGRLLAILVNVVVKAAPVLLSWMAAQLSYLSFSHFVLVAFSLAIGYFFGSFSDSRPPPPAPPPLQPLQPPQPPQPPQPLQPPRPPATQPTFPTCGICFEHEVSHVFLPCGHAICCGECAPAFDKKPCPLCRGRVNRLQTVYFSTA